MITLISSVNTTASLEICDALNNSGYPTAYRPGGFFTVELLAGDRLDVFEATIAKYYPELAIERSYLFSHLVTSTTSNRDTMAIRTTEVNMLAIREIVLNALSEIYRGINLDLRLETIDL